MNKAKIYGQKELMKTIEDLLPVLKSTKSTLVINGEAGTGKTFTIQELAKKRKYDLITRVLSNTTLEEIVGVSVVHTDQETGRKYFDKLMPKWLEKVYSDLDHPCILFLDELNRRVIPQQTLFSILDRKLVQGKKFNDNVILIACINSGHEYNVQEIDDRGLLNRVIMIDFENTDEDIILMFNNFANQEFNPDFTNKHIILSNLLIAVLQSVPNCLGEFANDNYISLRNWRNFYHYLLTKEVNTLMDIHKILDKENIIQSYLCSELIDKLREVIYQITQKTEKKILKAYNKKEKLEKIIQFEAQSWFITQLILFEKLNKNRISELIKMLVTTLDIGIIRSTLNRALPIIINSPKNNNNNIFQMILSELHKYDILKDVGEIY